MKPKNAADAWVCYPCFHTTPGLRVLYLCFQVLQGSWNVQNRLHPRANDGDGCARQLSEVSRNVQALLASPMDPADACPPPGPASSGNCNDLYISCSSPRSSAAPYPRPLTMCALLLIDPPMPANCPTHPHLAGQINNYSSSPPPPSSGEPGIIRNTVLHRIQGA
jgi:hypothetical protein